MGGWRRRIGRVPTAAACDCRSACHHLRPIRVVASAAKQSIYQLAEAWIASSLALLAMTWVQLRILATYFARGLHLVCPHRNQRAQGRPGASRTRGPACRLRNGKSCTRAYRYRRSIPAFPAQWLDGLSRALPGERLFCLRHQRDAFAPRGLDASTATSGPHDFAVRLRRARLSRHRRPPHPTARS
jgi:hypothetical protein